MNDWLLFVIGLTIGNVFGMFVMSMLATGKFADQESEIRDLRVQRQLLKEELLKQDAKPKPRKYRRRNKK